MREFNFDEGMIWNLVFIPAAGPGLQLRISSFWVSEINDGRILFMSPSLIVIVLCGNTRLV